MPITFDGGESSSVLHPTLLTQHGLLSRLDAQPTLNSWSDAYNAIGPHGPRGYTPQTTRPDRGFLRLPDRRAH